MTKGQITLPVFQSLEAYWSGVLSLIGDTSKAMRSLHNYHHVWKQYGFTPEFFNILQKEPGTNRESYPLRPELIESVMYLYRATGNPYLLEVGVDILKSIQHSSRTPCGYATIKDVRDHRKEDRMESFFLAETTKYLYLLFDTDNFLHNRGQHGTVIKTPHGECVIDTGGYIFNTEAHPIDPAALYCCHELPKENLWDIKKFQKNIKKYEGDSIANYKNFNISKLGDETQTVTIHNGEITEDTPDEDTEDEVSIETSENVQKSKHVEGTVEIVRLSNHELDDDKPITSQNDIIELKGVADAEEDASTAPNNDSDLSTEQNQSLYKEEFGLNNNTNIFQIIPDFINNYITPSIKKFNSQAMLERIRTQNKYPRNEYSQKNFSLLLCKAQPYLQRLSIMGEFFDE